MFELNLNIDHFLDTYWQKKPTVIKRGFINFKDPILADEMVGLATEEDVSSSLNYKIANEWQTESGPFSTFTALENDGVSLQIQAIEHWHAEAQELVRPFRFLPNWRIDNLMIRYSTPEGKIAPHLNGNDIFIIQGLGKQHWRVGHKITHAHRQQPCEAFSANLDVILESGDILYIPSDYPHEGEAISNSLNYNLNLHAPDSNELLTRFNDYCLHHTEVAPRYRDINIQIREKPGQVENQELAELYQLMLSRCQTPEALIPWLGRMLSTGKYKLDIAKIKAPHSTNEILHLFTQGAQFIRLGGLRAIYFEHSPELLFINGEQFNCGGFCELGHHLCDQDEVGSELFTLLNENLNALKLFTLLVNLGYWYVI